MKTPSQELLSRLALSNQSKIILLILDGVGDLKSGAQPTTALETADTPNLDALAARGSNGRLIPVAPGITPGSGPGHLALFGYDPRLPQHDIGRGVLEALGLGVSFEDDDVLARGNFASADASGKITDRRAGRISSATCEQLCAAINDRLTSQSGAASESSSSYSTATRVIAGEGHRFVLHLRGEGLSPLVSETDPQRVGVLPLKPTALAPEAQQTADLVAAFCAQAEQVIREHPTANRVVLRGFSQRPKLASLSEIFNARFGAFAGYPLYRGVASACGMTDVPASKDCGDLFQDVATAWNQFDFFFVHVKQTDQAGEDGDLDAKIKVIEEVDRHLPTLLALAPDVIAVTADHSTPAPMRAHSWHPVPLLIAGELAFVDPIQEFDENSVIQGHLGQLPATDLMALLFAHAGRLAKFGA